MSEPEADPRHYAHAAAVNAGRFEVPAVPGDWDTGMLRVITDSDRLTELMPLRRGQVQGPAVRGQGSAAGSDLLAEDLWWPAAEAPEAERQTAGVTADLPRRTKAASGARSTTAMATATVVSRVGGMLAQLLQAAALGSSVLATAFTVGNTLPNMIYFLIIGGALNAVFMPQLVMAMRRDPDGGAAYVNRLLTLVFCALLAVTAVATVAAPWIVDASADLDSAHRELAVSFARYCMPQIFFYGVFAVVGQVLGARGRFGPTAWAPVLNNVVVVAVFAGFILVGGGTRPGPGGPVLSASQSMFIGVGTTVGVLVQAAVVVLFLAGSGMRYRPSFDWRGAGLRQAAAPAKWTLAYMLVGQAVNILVMHLATGVDQDPAFRNEAVGYAAYSRAQQVWILPQSVITVSLLTMLLPRMSRAAADDDPAAVRRDLSLGLRVSGAAIVPCAFAFLALGPQFAVVLFGYGKTDVTQAYGIGHMLAAFGLGLIPFSAQYVILRGFYAFGDTRTPFTIGLITAAANAAIAVGATEALGGTRWPVVVMAGGSGLSSAIGLAWSVRRLRPRLAGATAVPSAAPGKGVSRVYRRLLLAATVAGVLAYAVAQDVGALVGTARPGSMLAAAAGGTALVVVYVLAAKALRVAEVEQLTRRVRGRITGLIPKLG